MWPRLSRTSATNELRRRFFDHGSHQAELQGVRRGLRPRGPLRLRPLLRAARGRLRARRPGRRARAPAHPGRSAEHLALPRLPPVLASRRLYPAAGPAGRRTPLSAPIASPSASASARRGSRNDTANLTHCFKDRAASVALRGRGKLGYKMVACALTGNLADWSAPTPPPRSCRRRVRAGRPGGAEDRRHRASTAPGGPRAWRGRRRPPALHRAGGERDGPSSTSTCAGRRRGLQDARRTRSQSSRLGAARPLRGPDGLGLGVHQKSTGASRTSSTPAWSTGELPVMNGAQAGGLLARGQGLCRRPRRLQPVRPDTIAKSLAIGNPADGPYALDLARRAAERSTRSPTTRSARASGCWPRRRASSRRPPAA